MKVTIGKNLETEKSFHLDVKTLLKTRLLVDANSGGGKSYLIRKIVEETHGHFQQIILDIEDDFSSLREKYDFILAGAGGDISVDPRTAEVFAHKILELEADVIVNLYELKQHQRIQFVKTFLESMIDAPKKLWHPTFVYLDEAHMFAPEGKRSESLNAVIDMASRGRKRGFCLVPATQRLAKLDKDVAAECRNKLIGLANIEIDRRRAAEELGLTDKETILSLRDLGEGEFYAVGPAFDRGLNRVQIGKVKTTHHEAGEVSKRNSRPMPTSKIQKVLAKLTDLPKEAEQELRDKESMLKKIAELKRELQAAKREVKVETKVEKIVDPKAIAKEVSKFKRTFLREFTKLTQEHVKAVGKLIENVEPEADPAPFPRSETLRTGAAANQLVRSIAERIKPKTTAPVDGNGRSFGRCERAIVKFLAMREGRSFTKVQVGALTGYSPGSGGFNNALSNLVQAGIIMRSSDRIQLRSGFDARSFLGEEYMAPEEDALVQWLNKLGKCERVIFDRVKSDGRAYTKNELGEITGYSPGSGGFNNAISRLNTLGLIQRNLDGTIELNSELVGI